MEWSALAAEWLARLGDASVRAVALAGAAAALAWCLRGRAAAQHALWAVVLTGMLALPWLRGLVPGTRIDLPRDSRAWIAQFAAPAGPAMPPAVQARPAGELASVPFSWALAAGMVYLGVALLLAVRLGVGLHRVRQLRRGARPLTFELDEPPCGDPALAWQADSSERVRVPVTVGWLRPRVLLPPDWRAWERGKLRAVLAHEFAHARRRDPLVALLARINVCLFWFHPLAWWLERRLAHLAEHAADDTAVAEAGDAAAYAQIVLDLAARLKGRGERVRWAAAALGGPPLARRIRRLLDPPVPGAARRLGAPARAAFSAGLAAAWWLCIALDFRAPAWAQTAPVPPMPFLFEAEDPNADPMAPEEAEMLKRRLADDPEDEVTRGRLLRYYAREGLDEERFPLILWLIEHHPESALHQRRSAAVYPKGSEGAAAAYTEARVRWRAQVERHPDDARVLGNAARALLFDPDSGREALGLFRRARKLDPERWTKPFATLCSLVLVASARPISGPRSGILDPAAAAEVHEEVLRSDDIALVGSVARLVVEQASQQVLSDDGKWDFARLRSLSTELVARACELEPANRQWQDLLAGVRGIPEISQPPGAAKPRLRVGAAVAAGRLQYAPALVYPADAAAARIQGVVRFNVRIGTDGRVREAFLTSGHPLLAKAAHTAVMQYLYLPFAMPGGGEAEAITTVDVEFRFPGR